MRRQAYSQRAFEKCGDFAMPASSDARLGIEAVKRIVPHKAQRQFMLCKEVERIQNRKAYRPCRCQVGRDDLEITSHTIARGGDLDPLIYQLTRIA